MALGNELYRFIQYKAISNIGAYGMVGHGEAAPMKVFTGNYLRTHVYIALARAVNDGFEQYYNLRKRAGMDMDDAILNELQDMEVHPEGYKEFWLTELHMSNCRREEAGMIPIVRGILPDALSTVAKLLVLQGSWIPDPSVAKDFLPEATELVRVQTLSQAIRSHVLGLAIFHNNVTLLNISTDKMVLHRNMFSLRAADLTGGDLDTCLIIFMHDR